METEVVLAGKGQFTLNKGLLKHLKVKTGEKVVLKKMPDHSVRIEAKSSQIDIMKLAGSLKSDKYFSEEEINNSISKMYIFSGAQ